MNITIQSTEPVTAQREETDMKTLIKKFAVAAAIIAISGFGAFAQEAKDAGEHKFEKAEAYYAQCPTAQKEEFKAIGKEVATKRGCRNYMKQLTNYA